MPKAYQLTEHEQRKSITIQFVGGPRDGEILAGTLENRKQLNECIILYLVHSNHGRVGTRTSGLSQMGMAAMQAFLSRAQTTPDGNVILPGEAPATGQHIYEVSDRHEDDADIRVTYNYLGAVENTLR